MAASYCQRLFRHARGENSWVITSVGKEHFVGLDDWLIVVESGNTSADMSDELRPTVPDAIRSELDALAVVSGDLRSGIPHEDDTYLILRDVCSRLRESCQKWGLLFRAASRRP